MVESGGEDYADGTTTASDSLRDRDSQGNKEEDKSETSLSDSRAREEFVAVELALTRSYSAADGRCWWSKNVLTNIVRMLTPAQIINLRLMCTSTRFRAAVFDVLPRLWKRHKERLSDVKLNLEAIDLEYMTRNKSLLQAMERWVTIIERSDDTVI
mmetsp:Transcript_39971/g.52275  ORF Transcript_39971/g.52275 Transcript_39971/m.52275 type:complete len:156 (+) Transcript_39971:45-512(+)